MNNIFLSKFVLIIKTWDEAELKAFEIWLKSPWCNTNKNLIPLFQKLKKYYPRFDNQKLTKEKLFYQILPKGKFSTRRMNNLLSEAYLSAERFLVFQNLAQNENLQRTLITQEFQKRHLEDWFFRDSDKAISKLEVKPKKDWEDYLTLFQLHRQVYHHPNQNPRMQPGGTTIVKMGEQIDLIYVLEKAAIINEKIFRTRILKDEHHDIRAALDKWQQVSKNIQHTAIDFYRMRFEYTEENFKEKYYELRAAFLERFEELNQKEQKIHLISLLNDTTLLVRANTVTIEEGLPLYKLGIESKILLNQGILPYNIYVTVVAGSNVKQDFSFTHQFIESYTTYLEQEFQADALYWAKAHTAYRQQHLLEGLDLLLSHEFKVHYFQLITRILTTQVYFDLYLEQDSYQSYLFNYFDAFEKKVLREKFRSRFIKKSYLRFIQICRILAKAYGDVNFKADKIRQLLKEESNIQASTWLSQKIETVIALKHKRPS